MIGSRVKFVLFFCAYITFGLAEQQIVIIGDSLSDSGNSQPLPAFIPGENGYLILPRYAPLSDGSTWPVVLAYDMGAKRLKPSISGGTNFAYVGAFTEGSNPFPLLSIPSLLNQVEMIPDNLNRKSPVFTFGGANNILFTQSDSPELIGAQAAQGMVHVLEAVNNKNFKTLILMNLPDLSRLPADELPPGSDYYRAASLAFNKALQNQLETLNVPVLQLDMYSLFDEIYASPTKYGFISNGAAPAPSMCTNNGSGLTCYSEGCQRCVEEPVNPAIPLIPLNFTNTQLFGTSIPLSEDATYYLGSSTSGYPFWYDETHPTQYAHDIIADYVNSIISAPSCFISLAQLPNSIIREQNTHIRQELNPLQAAHEQGLPYLFIAGDYSPLENAPYNNCCSTREASGGIFTIGVTDRISTFWTIGAAYSYSANGDECQKEYNKCSFDLQSNILSLFSGYEREHGYVNIIFNSAWLDYDQINRWFSTGPASHQAKADTHGMDYSGYVYGSYYFNPIACMKTGPRMDINYQFVSVNGYKEYGSDIGNLQFKGFNNQILSTGLGWELQLQNKLGCCMLVSDMYISANRQWINTSKNVYFREESLLGIWGAWPVELPSNNYASGGMNFSTVFYRITTSLGYTFNVGSHGMSEHFITAGCSIPLGKAK